MLPNNDTNSANSQSADQAAYDRAYKLGELAVADLRREIASALGQLGDPYLIRARISNHRIKTLESLRAKAANFGWSIPDALSNARDMIGFRVVCNNLQDARRAHELVRQALTNVGLEIHAIDYLDRPQSSGYRAIHLWFAYPVQAGSARMTLHCEIQFQSLLQNAWAELSHIDVYRGGLPPVLAKAMKRLSDRLHEADTIADGVRVRIAKTRQGRKPAPGAQLTPSTVAFLYRHAFGADPPDYVIPATLNELAGALIRTDALAALLDDREFIERLAHTYREANRLGVEADPTQLFRWAVGAATQDRGAAIREARKEGHAEWRYVDLTYRREALSDLPDDADDFVHFLRSESDDGDPYFNVLSWAQALDAASKCYCGEVLVDDDALADALIKRYRLRGSKAERARQKIIQAVANSGVDTGGGAGLCSYCWYVQNKDD